MTPGFGQPASLNLSAGLGEEGFWPSFTDVMMVVVIVFLLSSTVVVLHNWELVRQVQGALLEQARAQQEAGELSAGQARLRAQLAETEERLRFVRLELEGRERALAGSLEQIEALSRELQGNLERGVRQERELGEIRERLAALRRDKELGERMFVEVQARERQTRDELAALRDEHERMGREHRALVRPARSALGKTVASVRHQLRNGRPAYELRAPDAAGFEPLGATELHRRLAALKAQHGERLFIRIVIPMDSGLSYQEGWRFSLDLLNRYDYYYRK